MAAKRDKHGNLICPECGRRWARDSWSGKHVEVRGPTKKLKGKCRYCQVPYVDSGYIRGNSRLSLRAFVKLNREELSKAIVRAVPNIRQPLSLADLEQWVANDEGLYRWARSEGVRI